jgi:hypothetical protein
MLPAHSASVKSRALPPLSRRNEAFEAVSTETLGGENMGETFDEIPRARRFVIRFSGGKRHSFDILAGEDPLAALERHLRFFPDEAPEALEEQFYDPSHPRRFRYEDRGELLRKVLSKEERT